MANEAACAAAQEQARARHVENVFFLRATAEDIFVCKTVSLPPLHYLCADESEAALSASERVALFDLAEKFLLPGGLFHYNYRAYAADNGALRFLVHEFAPEMNADQARVFLRELKTLGGAWFAGHADIEARLDDAIAHNMPDRFFADYDGGEARSGSFDTIVALRPRGFVYAGDSTIPANYMDLSVPPEAQKIIFDCRDNHLYEPLKDFALNRTVRSDIWCRWPARQTSDLAKLFGPFTYGIVMPLERVPTEVKAQGKVVDLSSPLFKKLVALMTLMPISVGDFLAHADGKDFAPVDIIGAIQILVACDIARPMRGLYQAGNISNISQPRFVGSFNQFLSQTEVSGEETWLASPTLGGAMSVPAREALVMQALDRAGLVNSVSALLPELQRLAKNPVGAARIMDAAEPTAASAHHMIEDTVSRSIVQWYAYGLLEAA
jgi:hypothetical protein